ncbi:MAG: metallophosphoesterase [Ferruginibacter sp.]
MKIQYCSDLHLEFPENNHYINRHPLKPTGEILILAGDVLPFALNHHNYKFFDFVADNFEAVYWIPGNHEYYGYDVAKAPQPLLEKIRSNVFLVNNHTIVYQEVNIICSTLWSYINPDNELLLMKCLSDFTAITMNGKAFLPCHFNELHTAALFFVKEEVGKNASSKKIVVTHHVPTLQHYPAKYKKSVLNEGFAVELYDFIQSSGICYWLYGHHHSNTEPFSIGSTVMLTNQLGYVRKYEHGSYKKNAVFEI